MAYHSRVYLYRTAPRKSKHSTAKTTMKSFHIIIIALLTAVITGCSSIDCNIEGRVQCHYTIQDQDGNGSALNYPISVSLHRTAVGSDTVYINQMSSVSSFDLPMSYGADTDEIALTLHLTDSTSITDVIWVTKTNIPQFESVDCAPRYNHQLQSTRSTHNFIDTVLINNPKVSNDASVSNIHIRLYGSNS